MVVLVLFTGFGLGAMVGGSAAGVAIGSSVFLVSDCADSVGGAEINALIWKRRRKLLRYLGLHEAENVTQ